MKKSTIILTTLAMNQTIFFVGLAKELKKNGNEVFIISFHEDSCNYIKEQGIDFYNIFSYKYPSLNIKEKFSDYVKLYNINNVNLILSHEKVAFNIQDTSRIMHKYITYFNSLELIYNDIRKKSKSSLVTVQELGGFSSILSTYFYSIKNNIDNIFIEPSFFRGRIFFVKNSLSSINIKDKENVKITSELKEYLDNTLEEKKIVIPTKDKMGYRNPINKIINFHNIKRLIEKSYSKFFLKRNEEFSHIGFHVRKHFRMFFNQILLKTHYKEIPKEKFIYFPMHVPNDVALTVRSPEYLDQLGLIYYISRNLPLGYKLVTKEHPAMLGDIDRKRMINLLKNDENIILLKPDINNFDVLNKAEIILTVNSKAGAEAILNNKKVIVLGDAFYDLCEYISKVDNIKDIYQIIQGLSNYNELNSEQNIYNYFQNIWNQSYLGDLYYDEIDNYKNFAKSLERYLNE
jgi:capsule polysaccharide modification protein KpsS